MNFPPEAQKGKSVKAAWNALRQWAKSTVLRPGPGVRLAYTSAGTIINFHAPRQVFRGAFSVSVFGDRASVGFGTIEGIEPTIAGKPASEGGTVAFKPQDSDSEGRLWLVLRVTLNGKKISETLDAVTIAQASDPRILAGPQGIIQHPLAMLRSPDPKKPGMGATLHQIEYFHLRLLFAGERPFILPVA
jgi:hypothetical protein